MASDEYSRILQEMRPLTDRFDAVPKDAPALVTTEILARMDPWFERAQLAKSATESYGPFGWRPSLGPWSSVSALIGHLYDNHGGGIPVEFLRALIVLAYDEAKDAAPDPVTPEAAWSPETRRTLGAFGAFLGLAVALWLTDWSLEALLWLVRETGLENVVWLVAATLVLLRNPIPGQSRLGRWRGWSTTLLVIRGTTLLFALLLLGTGLILFEEFRGIPGFGPIVVVVAAAAALSPQFRGHTNHPASRLETVFGLALVVGLIVRAFVWDGSGLSAFNSFFASIGGAAVLLGLAILTRLPVRPFPPFDDPFKLILAGGTAMLAALSDGLGIAAVVALALLVLPTLVAIVELQALVSTAGFAPRGPGLAVLEALKEPDDQRERNVRRIKGTFRRIRTRELIAAGEEPNADFLTHELAEHLKLALQMQVGSQARGGEDLPDLLDGEVELARITYSETVHGEVVSLRGRRAGDDVIALRLVDEYGTEFALPFDQVRDSITPEDVARIFREADPSPVDVGPFLAMSEVFPELSAVFSRKFEHDGDAEAPRGIGAGIRNWFTLGMTGFVVAWRMALDFKGHSISVETRMYGFGVVVIRGLVIGLAPALTAALWALALPVPALVVRRIRTIGFEAIREDLPKLAISIIAVAVIGALALDLPLWFGAAGLGPVILMLYLMFRQGPMEREILASQWN